MFFGGERPTGEGFKRLRGLEVLAVTSSPGGWLTVARRTLRNVYEDGTRSAPYVADTAHRPGVDAVAVLPFRRTGRGPEGVEVLLRACLRPGVELRARLGPPVVDPEPSRPMLWEAPAGIPEGDEQGLAGLRRCGARELAEETGLVVEPDALWSLGAGTYPSGGILAEMLHLFACEVGPQTPVVPVHGDGSPFEEAGELRWFGLEEALEACVGGLIADAKTEVALGRLARRLTGA